MLINELLNRTTGFFREKNISSPRLEAEILFSHAFRKSRVEIIMSLQKEAESGLVDTYRELVRRRSKGEPIAYIIGEKEFYSLSFKVSSDVLIPRPETEMLVEIVVDWAVKRGAEPKQKKSPRSAMLLNAIEKEAEKERTKEENDGAEYEDEKTSLPPVQVGTLEKETDLPSDDSLKFCPAVLDIGTGSGCILTSILSELPKAAGVGTDISEKAIAIAEENLSQHSLTERTELFQGNLADPVENRLFDCIVSNPPYIPENDTEVSPEVKDFEPSTALFAGTDGLDIIRKLLPQAFSILNKNGLLAMEFGIRQGNKVAELLKENGFENIEIRKDLAGIERVVMGTKN